MSELTILDTPPISMSGGALYPYSESLLEALVRTGKYDDAPYSLGRVVGTGSTQKIVVPRHMAPDPIPDETDYRTGGRGYEFESAFVPRTAEQARVVEETVELLEAGHNFMVEAPTGFGKTACAMDIIARIGRKTLVIVTKDDIYAQWVKEAKAMLGLSFGNGLGVIKADKIVTMNCGLVIAFVQSVAKEGRYEPAVFQDFGLVIVDECHRIGADFFSQSMFRCPAFMRFGLSATPDRKDGKEEVLFAHLGPVMVSTSVATVTPKVIKKMSPWKCPMVTVRDKKTGQNKVVEMPHNAGKCAHVIKMLARHSGRNKLMTDFIHAAFQKGRKILVMSDLRDHLEELAGMLYSYPGIHPAQVAFFVGGLKESQRDEAMKAPIILATYMMTKEGTDIPGADTLVMATPKSDVRQIVGRVTRLAKGSATVQERRVFDVVDETSSVFKNYWRVRKQWYDEAGIEVLIPMQKAPSPTT